jgi:hypothetical protein
MKDLKANSMNSIIAVQPAAGAIIIFPGSNAETNRDEWRATRYEVKQMVPDPDSAGMTTLDSGSVCLHIQPQRAPKA